MKIDKNSEWKGWKKGRGKVWKSRGKQSKTEWERQLQSLSKWFPWKTAWENLLKFYLLTLIIRLVAAPFAHFPFASTLLLSCPALPYLKSFLGFCLPSHNRSRQRGVCVICEAAHQINCTAIKLQRCRLQSKRVGGGRPSKDPHIIQYNTQREFS